MILVDTSVWIYPRVIGELACGNLQNRGQVLRPPTLD